MDRVQPWTGVVLWTDHAENNTPAIQLEYSYVGYNQVVSNDQRQYQSLKRIREAGMASGYRLRMDSLKTNGKVMKAIMANVGVAPMYHDAYVAVGDVRSSESLRGLLPGQSKEVAIQRDGTGEVPTIQSDRIVAKQIIQYDADLK